jgi:hypothetical protein
MAGSRRIRRHRLPHRVETAPAYAELAPDPWLASVFGARWSAGSQPGARGVEGALPLAAPTWAMSHR